MEKSKKQAVELFTLRQQLDHLSSERARHEIEIEKLLAAIPGGAPEKPFLPAQIYKAPFNDEIRNNIARGTIVEMEVEKALIKAELKATQADLDAMQTARVSLADFKAKTENKPGTKLPKNIADRPWISDARKKPNAKPVFIQFDAMLFK